MPKEFHIENISISERTDKIIDNSETTNPFIYSSFQECLKEYGYNSYSFIIYQNKEIKALVHIPQESDDFLHDLVVYSGIIFIKPQPNQKYVQIVSERHLITCFAAEEVAKFFKFANFNCSPEIIDMRGWLWHDYQKRKNNYSVSPRYTGIIDLSKIKKENVEKHLLLSMGSSRRQEYKKSFKANEYIIQTSDITNLVKYYRKNMEKQNELRTLNFINCLTKILLNSLKKNNGIYIECFSATNKFLAGSFWLITKNKAIYFWGSKTTDQLSSSAGTRVLIESMKNLHKEGITMFDLEGINSPQRGWFKVSLGSMIIPYYSVKLN